MSSNSALTTLKALGYNTIAHTNIYIDDTKLNNLAPMDEIDQSQGIFIIDIPDYENYSLDNDDENEDDDYADGRVAAETIRRLKAAQARRAKDGTPFFITAGFVRPHLPFSAPKKYWDMFDSAKLPMPENEKFPKDAPQVALKRGGEISAYKPVPVSGQVSEALKRELIHGYYASTTYVDAQIGKVTAALNRLGLAKNTIIVLWGDHGWHLGDLSIWTKHTNFEQANRIPILIVAPGVVKSGSVTRQLTETVDLYPTLAELTGFTCTAIGQQREVPGVAGSDATKNPVLLRGVQQKVDPKTISYAESVDNGGRRSRQKKT